MTVRRPISTPPVLPIPDHISTHIVLPQQGLTRKEGFTNLKTSEKAKGQDTQPDQQENKEALATRKKNQGKAIQQSLLAQLQADKKEENASLSSDGPPFPIPPRKSSLHWRTSGHLTRASCLPGMREQIAEDPASSASGYAVGNSPFLNQPSRPGSNDQAHVHDASFMEPVLFESPEGSIDGFGHDPADGNNALFLNFPRNAFPGSAQDAIASALTEPVLCESPVESLANFEMGFPHASEETGKGKASDIESQAARIDSFDLKFPQGLKTNSPLSKPISLAQLDPFVTKQLENILGTSLSLENPDLRPALDRHIQGLTNFLEMIQLYRKANLQPDNEISLRDGHFSPHVAAMENFRHPTLKMAHFDNLSSFVDCLKESIDSNSPLPSRVLVRTGDNENVTHHQLAIDIVNEDGKLSLIAIEPANIWQRGVQQGMKRLNAELSRLEHRPYIWSYLATNLQNSENDCTPIGFSFCKKMADEEEFMRDLHRKQLTGKTLRPSTEDATFKEIEKTAVPSPQHLHEVIAKTDIFPISFLKHAQSPSKVDSYLKARPENSEVKVNKAHADKPAQTLKERVVSYVSKEGRVKPGKNGHGEKILNYSLSAEVKRETTIIDTLQFFKNLRESLQGNVAGHAS